MRQGGGEWDGRGVGGSEGGGGEWAVTEWIIGNARELSTGLMFVSRRDDVISFVGAAVRNCSSRRRFNELTRLSGRARLRLLRERRAEFCF